MQIGIAGSHVDPRCQDRAIGANIAADLSVGANRKPGKIRGVDTGREYGIGIRHHGLSHHVDAIAGRVDAFHGADHPGVVFDAISRRRQVAAEGLPADDEDLASPQVRYIAHAAIERNGCMVVAVVNAVDDYRAVTVVYTVRGNRFVGPRRQVCRNARSGDLEVDVPSRAGEKQPETGRDKVSQCNGFRVHDSPPG